MDHILNLKKNTAATRLESLAETIAYKNGFPCELYDNKYSNVSAGETYTNENGRAYFVKIDIHAIKHAKRTVKHFLNPTVSDTDFAKIIINMYHEYMHCIQKNNLFKQEHLDKNSMN